MGWLRCFTNHSICRSLADHSCLRHSSFDPLSAIAHSRNTVSSHEPETPGLRELAASWRPEENPCQSGFFSESLFFCWTAYHPGTAPALHSPFFGAAYNFLKLLKARVALVARSDGVLPCLSHPPGQGAIGFCQYAVEAAKKCRIK